jgi:hypothetical protein
MHLCSINQALDIEIDALTESVVEVSTGEIFKTDVSKVSIDFLKNIHKKNGWKFNWKKESKEENRLIYKLVLVENKSILLGLISFEIKQDHVHIHLIENSPKNVGKIKVYQGIAGNLFAFACKFSSETGFNGVVSFYAKTQLIEHYSVTLGAIMLSYNKMIIPERNAYLLVCKYFSHEKK